MRAALICAAGLLIGCSDPGIGSLEGSPLDHLPENIRLLHSEGMRADFSGDGQRLLFLDALIGNVHEMDLASEEIRPLTAHFEHAGFTRARYLANGDLLLCGPEANAAANTKDGGRWHSALWYLPANSDQPAQHLGEPCHEGPAVARSSMRIAWNVSDFPDKVVFGRSEIWMATLALNDGKAELTERRKVVDRSAFYYLAFLEVQDFRPPAETELLFSAYAWRGGEVMGIDLATNKVVNYSKNWGYDEPEGVFADGESIAVEREPYTYTAVPKGDIDIWRLPLDGSAEYERMTRFTDFAGYGASNPVVSPDGRYMAFQLRIKGGDHGNGAGLLLYELEQDEGSESADTGEEIEAIMAQLAAGEDFENADDDSDADAVQQCVARNCFCAEAATGCEIDTRMCTQQCQEKYGAAEGEPICCESFGYGNMMKKCCESYEFTAAQNCKVPALHVGGDRRIVADSYCQDSAKP